MKCIFIGNASGGKGHRLWCTEEQTPKFVISIDVIFESAMCNQVGGGTSVAENDQDANQKVGLETETPHSFVINEEQQGGKEHHRREESLVQPMKEVIARISYWRMIL